MPPKILKKIPNFRQYPKKISLSLLVKVHSKRRKGTQKDSRGLQKNSTQKHTQLSFTFERGRLYTIFRLKNMIARLRLEPAVRHVDHDVGTIDRLGRVALVAFDRECWMKRISFVSFFKYRKSQKPERKEA
jgi:hypothetical protein